MRWIDDPSGRFPARPYFEAAELDALGGRLAAEAAQHRGRRRFEPPLDTDALLVLVERHVDDLDLFADLERALGPGVEAVTEFRPGRPPVVRVDRRLAGDPRRQVRLRFTIAHELAHVLLHRDLWEQRFAQRTLFPRPASLPEAARSHPREAATATGARPATDRPEGPGWEPRCSAPAAREADWLEWQAGYAAGALLVPVSALGDGMAALLPGVVRPGTRAVAPTRRVVRGGTVPAARGGRTTRPVPFAGTLAGDAIVDAVSRAFAVSPEAATVRLAQTGWLRDPADPAQGTLWAG